MRRSGTINIDGAVVESHHIWYVREELRHYPRRKQRLSYLETCIATATGVNETPGIQAGTISDPTGGRAAALLKDQERAWLAPRIQWVDRVYAMMEPVTRQVLDMLVVQGHLTGAGVAIRLSIPERTVYREMYRGLLALAVAMWGDEIIVSGKMPKRTKVAVSRGSIEVKSAQ